MNRNLKAIWLRNFTAACLALVIFTTSSMVALATPGNKTMGEITVSGVRTNGIAPFVMLNGENAFNGRTFFSAGTIVTPADVNSTVNLGKLGSVSLSPNTTLSLSFDEKTISGTLSAGQISVSNNEGVAVQIQTNNGVVTNANSTGSMIVTAENAAQQDDDASGDGNSALGPVLVLSGIVATAVILVFIARRDDDGDVSVSPVR